VSPRSTRRGFTLIEVLVALAIAAMGLAAALSVVTNSTRNAAYFRDRTIASWIAQNRITEARLATTLPSVDKTSGDLTYAGNQWKWEQSVTQTEVPGLRRIDVSVRPAEADAASPMSTVSGFVGRTAVSAPPSSSGWDVGPGAAANPGATPPLTHAATGGSR
jgi:general secretion pathway protein I